MPYELTRKPDCTVTIEGRLDAAEVAESRRSIVERYRRRAQVPGFRKGKAPLALVEKRFASEVGEELEEELSRTVWTQVLDGEDDRLEPISPLSVAHAHLHDDGSFHLEGSVEVRPRFDLPDPAGLTVPEIEVEPTEEEIAEELESLRERQAMWEPAPDATAADGMLVELDLDGRFPDSDELDDFRQEEVRMVLGRGEAFPELDAALQGAAVGEERTATHRFPEDLDDAARAGRTLEVTATVKELRRRQLPDLDDDLAATMGLEGLDELREKVGEMVRRRKEQARRQRLRRELLDQLEEGLDPGALPPSVVRRSISEELERHAYGMAMQGRDPRTEEIDWQALSAEAEPAARRRALDGLVLEQLAIEWKVPVPEDDVDEWVRQQAARQGVPPAEHKASLAKSGELDGVRHAAVMGATVDELIRRAAGGQS